MRASPTSPLAPVTSVLLVMSLVATAEAQEARRLFREGLDALQAGDYERAATALPRSYELEPLPETICNLALTYDRWPEHQELAADMYARCAREDRSGLFRQQALDREREIRAALPRSPAPPATPTPTPIPITASGPEPVPPRNPSSPTDARHPDIGRPPPASAREPPPESRSHGLLYAGLAAGALSVAAFLGGLAFIEGARADAEALDERYDGGQTPIPRGSGDADLFASASRRSDMGVGLYVAAGVLAAVAMGLVVFDATQSDPAPTDQSGPPR